MATALSLPRMLLLRGSSRVVQTGVRVTTVPAAQRRTFLPGLAGLGLPGVKSEPQRFTENRTLPYGAYPVAALIKDIDAYSSYLPYCISSIVTESSGGLPSRATLAVGFGPLKEQFESRVFCRRWPDGKVQGEGIEALEEGAKESWEAGAGEKADTALYTVTADGGGNEVFERCYTRWSVRGLKEGGSSLGLDIEYVFKNPVYAALSAQVLPRIGSEMIMAFEKRAGDVLGVKRRFG